MNEIPKDKRSWRVSRAVLIWLISFTLIVLVTGIAFVTTDRAPKKSPDILLSLLFGALGASILVCLLVFIRWLGGWRNVRRLLIGLAVLATLIAIFYTEEDWRGKRAWENCKSELEAKGIVMDWEKFIPPPVPDDQNFFKASQKIAYSFVKATNDAQAEFFAKQPRYQFGPTASNSFPVFDTTNTRPLVVVVLTVIPPGGAAPQSCLKLNNPGARSEAGKVIAHLIGRSANGSQGFKFSEVQLSNLAPAQILVQEDTPPTVGDLEKLIPPDVATNIGHLRVESTADPSTFQVSLTGVHITAAADYLKWSDQFEPDFAEIREALKRPYARIDCDYSQSYLIAIPNFVTMRGLAQTLAQRTQCYLLLGQPDKALRELTLMNDSRRILLGAPTGKPMTLVASMINVAVSRLYADTIAYGLQLNAWREPQLLALQEQLQSNNLLPYVAESFREEPVHASLTLETTTPTALAALVSGHPPENLWQKLGNPYYRLLKFAPRGWVYQNIKFAVTMGQKWNEIFDLTNDLILPGKAENAYKEVSTELAHWSPWNIWSRIAIPNFTKAWQTTAHNQTLVNEAQIACALERYRLAHGEYPETLNALVPQFIEKLPHDIVGGGPLHYRRTDNGNFVLYSVGWNETDDGGLDGGADFTKGDWVWRN